MSQNRETGAAGNEFGRKTAPNLANAIGAAMNRPGSNEADWKGRRIVIKCAKVGNNRIGVIYRMLETLDAVVAAFQRIDGRFDLYELPPSICRQQMSPTRSLGPSNGNVGMLSRATFESLGKHLGNFAA